MPKHPVQIQRDEHNESALAKRVDMVSSTTINAVVNTAAAGQSSVVLDTGSSYIGLATVDIGSSPILTVDATGQGDVPITLGGEAVALAASSAYVGLATVIEATEKTLQYLPIAGNTSGAATIFVPTNTFNVTNLILSAAATVGVNIKAGATYLTGNASLNMTLFPGGGFVESGDLLNPVYNGMADAASFVIETDDTVEIAGKVVYYEQ